VCVLCRFALRFSLLVPKKSNNNNNDDDDDDDDDDNNNNNNNNNNNTAMGSVHARDDIFLTFGLKALTERNTSRLATASYTDLAALYNTTPAIMYVIGSMDTNRLSVRRHATAPM
jgi:hypothetical protein